MAKCRFNDYGLNFSFFLGKSYFASVAGLLMLFFELKRGLSIEASLILIIYTSTIIKTKEKDNYLILPSVSIISESKSNLKITYPVKSNLLILFNGFAVSIYHCFCNKLQPAFVFSFQE